MEIINTKEDPQVPNQVMVIYGQAGVGKSTFVSTAPKPLLIDFENGSKFFKDRGIEIDVIRRSEWFTDEDKKQLAEVIEAYETIAIDPIGEAMEKLILSPKFDGSKNRQSDGSLTMAGWGAVKKEMKNFLKWLISTGKNVIIIAHVEEKDDEGKIVKRPLMATKLSQDLINMVDFVGYMMVVEKEGEQKRVIALDSSDGAYLSKDRSGKLGKFVKPDFNYIVDLLKPEKEDDKETKQENKETKKPAKKKAKSKKAEDKETENE